MPVGNHTRAHADLTRLSSAAIRQQITSNEHLFEQVLGRPMKKLLRPPYGAYDSQVLAVARSLGYRVVLWSIDTRDWVPGTSAATIAARASAGHSGSIVLMHCGPRATARALPSIIRSYQARGYHLVGLGRLLSR
jgi:peptidoglycan/xylan/chitin deacetylase (PgdA/CDA1 family)